jgi:hypothetical protein
MKGAVAAPMLLVQVHIPRSAGTSIRNWLRLAATSGLTSGHADLYPSYEFTGEDDLRAAGLADPRITTASTHNIRTFPDTLCGRPTRYFTIIREPFDHFASLVRYMLEHRERFKVPRRLTTQRDVAEWFLDARFGEVGSENTQTNHLALYPWCETTSGRCDAASYARWSAEDHHAYWDARLDLAKDALASFACVGVFDRLPETLRLLRARSAQLGIQLLPAEDVPSINESVRTPGDTRWLDRGTPLGELVAQSLADDMQLYEHAQAMLDRSLRRAAWG